MSESADQHRRLSGKAASEPGPWRTSQTPYLREIMDCLSSASSIERVVVMKGAQIGISECCNNWIGYVIYHAPAPVFGDLGVNKFCPMRAQSSERAGLIYAYHT